MLEINPAEQPAQATPQEGAVPVPPESTRAGAVIETGAQKAEDARLLAAEKTSELSPLQQHIAEVRYGSPAYGQDVWNGAAILARRMESHRDYVPFTVTNDCAVAIGILSTLGLPSFEDTRIFSTLNEPGLPQRLAVHMDTTQIYGLINSLSLEDALLGQLRSGMELLQKVTKSDITMGRPEFAYERNLIEAMSRDGKLSLAINIEDALKKLLYKIRDIVVARERQQPIPPTGTMVETT